MGLILDDAFPQMETASASRSLRIAEYGIDPDASIFDDQQRFIRGRCLDHDVPASAKVIRNDVPNEHVAINN